MTSRFMLFSDSATAVELYPEWDLVDKSTKLEALHRTRSGRSFRYKFGDYAKFAFSLTDVVSADASQVNSWWGANTDLLFTQDSGTTVSSVQLFNKSKPMGQYDKPYETLFKGKIELEGN